MQLLEKSYVCRDKYPTLILAQIGDQNGIMLLNTFGKPSSPLLVNLVYGYPILEILCSATSIV